MANTPVTFENLLANYRIMKRTMANGNVMFVVQKANPNLALGWEDHFTNQFTSVETASSAIETEINQQLSTMVISMEEVPFVYRSTTTSTTTNAPVTQ